MSSNALEQELKEMIIESLELEDVTPEDIDSEEALFVEGLGLDSIDALELGLALQKRYGITLESDSDASRQHFANIKSLAALVEARRAQ